MQLRPEISIHAMIKSLTDAVLPAVDPSNKLAVEQLQLTIGLLSMMEQRLPLEFKFDCDELRRLLAFADELKTHTAGNAAFAEFSASADAGADVLRRAQADPAEVLAAVRRLRASGGALAAAAYREGGSATRAAIMKSVLSMSGEQLLRDRAWVSPQGWEPRPQDVPPITDLLPASR
jgi:hypothetical protein